MKTYLHKNWYWSKSICARKLNSFYTYAFFYGIFIGTLIITDFAEPSFC